MTWWKTSSGYVNGDTGTRLEVRGSGPYTIWIYNGPILEAGPYATSTDALEAIRKLVHGVDASTIV